MKQFLEILQKRLTQYCCKISWYRDWTTYHHTVKATLSWRSLLSHDPWLDTQKSILMRIKDCVQQLSTDKIIMIQLVAFSVMQTDCNSEKDAVNTKWICDSEWTSVRLMLGVAVPCTIAHWTNTINDQTSWTWKQIPLGNNVRLRQVVFVCGARKSGLSYNQVIKALWFWFYYGLRLAE